MIAKSEKPKPRARSPTAAALDRAGSSTTFQTCVTQLQDFLLESDKAEDRKAVARRQVAARFALHGPLTEKHLAGLLPEGGAALFGRSCSGALWSSRGESPSFLFCESVVRGRGAVGRAGAG